MESAIEIKYNLEQTQLDTVQEQELQDLLTVCHQNMDFCDDKLISDAFKLCFLSHRGVTRASGEPYYRHPLDVAHIVITEIGIDDISVVAALLHDTVEDTDVTLDFINDYFGSTVGSLIDGVTKISGVFDNRGARQAETFMKLLLSMAEDLRVVLIKFADRLHNMRTLGSLPRKKQVGIAAETIELYAPLAHRFGLFEIKSELEDLSFKTADPESFKFIARKLKEKKEARESFIEQFMIPVQQQLVNVGFHFEIKGRPKHIYSIYRKMIRQQKPFEEVYDLFAIRIILQEPHTKEDCWRVYSFITDAYTPIPERFRDFISVPKANGYQSLHTTVITDAGRKVEVQIRTQKMDEIAEKGLAAHWKYKEGGDQGSQSIDKFVHWVRDILDNPRPEAAVDFVKDFQLNLYSDEIYVFTPKGELRTLPSNASPIDFAFEIHSEVGDHAIAAKVNGKIVPLRHKLTSGDQVEIITGKSSNINPDWMNDVVTHKARSRIRQFIKQKRKLVAAEGRESFEKKAEKAKLKLSKKELSDLAIRLQFANASELFYEIGSGHFDVMQAIRAARSLLKNQSERMEGKDEIKKPSEEDMLDRYVDDARSHGDFRGLVINGEVTNVKYAYAKCCNPLPGDDVLGFISRTGEIKIHRTTCKNLGHIVRTDPDRIVDVAWSKQRSERFVGAIKVIGEDRVGMLNDITNLISTTLRTNIKSINVGSESGLFEGTLILFVDDVDHLSKIMKRLETIEGIRSAYRFE